MSESTELAQRYKRGEQVLKQIEVAIAEQTACSMGFFNPNGELPNKVLTAIRRKAIAAVAAEHWLDEKEVRRDVRLAEAMKTIELFAGRMFVPAILSGKITITVEQLLRLAKLDPEKLEAAARQLVDSQPEQDLA